MSTAFAMVSRLSSILRRSSLALAGLDDLDVGRVASHFTVRLDMLGGGVTVRIVETYCARFGHGSGRFGVAGPLTSVRTGSFLDRGH